MNVLTPGEKMKVNFNLKKSRMAKTISLFMILVACSEPKFTEVTDVNTPLGTGDDVTAMVKTVYVDPAKDNPNLDILMVIDDSSSMKADVMKLADKLSNFTSLLDASGLQWQMCLTTTQGYITLSGLDFGRSVLWQLPSGRVKKVVSRGQSGLDSIFKTTFDSIPIGGSNSRDERGLRATQDHLYKNSDCYRPGANVATILISDEDEASVGGDITRIKNQEDLNNFVPLTSNDRPAVRLQNIMNKIGNVHYTFNSLIIKPNDSECEYNQNLETPAYSGGYYAELSRITNGGIGSICDSDYSKSLVLFKDKIVNSLTNVTLDCVPYQNVVNVAINGKVTSSYSLNEKVITFNEPVPEKSTIEVRYGCLKNP